MIKERAFAPINGWGPAVLFAATLVVGPTVFIVLAANGPEQFWPSGFFGICAGLSVLTGLFGLFGCLPVQPNQARVLLLFGNYIGSVVESGFYWVNPLYNKKKISLRIRNFETGSTKTPEEKDAAGRVIRKESRRPGRPSKVNDRDGNPIDISAVVVWRVVNTAEALFEVDDYDDFLAVQSEAALRSLAEPPSVRQRRSRGFVARKYDRDLRSAQTRHSRSVGESWDRSHRGPYQPFGICARNRRSDVATATSSGRGRRAYEDRRRSRRHGGNGADGTFQGQDRRFGRRTPRPHGVELVGGLVQRPPRSASGQCR